jgi:hypothetical protein
MRILFEAELKEIAGNGIIGRLSFVHNITFEIEF